MMIKRRVGPGFTLIELLVVIVIITILAALLFPAFTYAIASAHRSACATNLKELAQGVELYRQESGAYPLPPNFIGAHGIPQGGMSGLVLINQTLSESSLWCPDDEYPILLPGGVAPPKTLALNGMLKDNTGSTYNYGYNYYGYVTTLNNTPFPITTQQAFCYFMGNPYVIDATLTPATLPWGQWNLGLVKTNDPTKQPQYDAINNSSSPNPGLTVTDVHPAGLSQCLRNTWAPANTIVAFCPNHLLSTDANLLPAVMLSGETSMLRTSAQRNNRVFISDIFYRGANQSLIDWRLDKALLANGTAFNNAHDGDAPYATTATQMPVVQVTYRNFPASSLVAGTHWFDTGVRLQSHDFVMVVAHAKWAWAGSTIENAHFTDPGYQALTDLYGNLWFSADGDPVEVQKAYSQGFPAGLLCPTGPHCLLVGQVGAGPTPFAIGSRGSHLVTPTEDGELLLTLNDTLGVADYSDNVGWCEVWIAVCHPAL